MNKLSLETRTKIIQLLVEGNSLRACSRILDVSINTVSKLLVDVGRGCYIFHDQVVNELTSRRIQCDEIWSFVYAKQKNVTDEMKDAGDMWTWVGMDADSKMIVSWYVGPRDVESADIFMRDVASRLKNKVQLTTDGFKAYLDAVDNAFHLKIDYAQLVKIYGDKKGEITDDNASNKYKNYRYKGAEHRIRSGSPNPKFISTSYIERQNLTMRMHIRRFTRKTNAFSKKFENHCHAIALHFVYYNFAKIHTSLSVTPAMQAGLMKKPMSIADIVRLAD